MYTSLFWQRRGGVVIMIMQAKRVSYAYFFFMEQKQGRNLMMNSLAFDLLQNKLRYDKGYFIKVIQ